MAASYEPQTEGEKRCTGCGEVKPLSDFKADKRKKSGRGAQCKPCHVAESRARHAASPEKYKAKYRDFYARNREAERARSRARGRWKREHHPDLANFWIPTYTARKHGVEIVEPHIHRLIVLEMDDGVCGVCGEDVDPFDYQVDHIIPVGRGGEHSYANVQVAHPICNQRKNDQVLL